MFTQDIAYTAALSGGVLSFFSPCILPLLPAYFSFITGLSLDQLTENKAEVRKKVILTTLFFVAGISATFIMIGGAASFLGSLLNKFDWLIRYAGGAIVIVFGLHILNIININALNFEKKIHVPQKPAHLMGTFVIGMAFGAGWTPCIGPIFSSILVLAGNEGSVIKGFSLLAVYSVGFCVPFLIMAVFITSLLDIVKRMNRYIGILNTVSGILLVLIGLLLITNQFRLLSGLFYSLLEFFNISTPK